MSTDTVSDAINPYVSQMREEGYCVLEDVIPSDVVDSVREEVETSEADYSAFSKDNGHWTRNVISFMPGFAEHLANERLLAVIRELLGPQVRISQTEYKIRPSSLSISTRISFRFSI